MDKYNSLLRQRKRILWGGGVARTVVTIVQAVVWGGGKGGVFQTHNDTYR